jgi:hypothetical protein
MAASSGKRQAGLLRRCWPLSATRRTAESVVETTRPITTPASMATVSPKSKRKEDALALAQLLYDIFKQKRNDDKISEEQNNANQTEGD